MIAVVLAGGYGKRLRPLTDDRPKPLIEVAGKPIIEWQILWLKKFGINSFLFLTGYKKEVFVDWIAKNSTRLGITFALSVEEEPLGTGGAIRRAKGILENFENFLVINGDIITDIDVSKLRLNENYIVAISLVPLKSPYGIIRIDSDSRVISFEEKPILKEYWINAGVYLMSKEVFKYLPEKGDLERQTFPILAEKGLIKGYKFEKCYWKAIDTHKDLEEANEEIKRGDFYNIQ